MKKSRLDILVSRQVLTEKQSIASIAVDMVNNLHKSNPENIPFIVELDSNKLAVMTYPNDSDVNIFIGIILRSSDLHRNIVKDVSESISRNANSREVRNTGFIISSVQEVNNYMMFSYSSRTGGAAVLNSMIKDTLITTLTIEALRLEKFLIDYGK